MEYMSMNKFHKILKTSIEKKYSDLHLTANKKIFRRYKNKLKFLDTDLFSENDLQEIVRQILNEEQKKDFLQKKSIDCSYTYDLYRFRINIYTSLFGIGMAIRLVNKEIFPIDKFAKAEVLKRIILKQRGLVLVCGATGMGKSTTLASMIDYLNKHVAKHIITLEDPVEYIFFDDKSLIHQREYGKDFIEFSEAIKMAMRQDPDVIMIGEIRDYKTMKAALNAAETGHLVLGTLHSASVVETLMRIEGFFASNEIESIRMQIAGCLNSIIVQRLLSTKDENLVCCMEILLANSAIKNIIRQGYLQQVYSQIQLHKKIGMCSMQDTIENLLKDKILDENHVDI